MACFEIETAAKQSAAAADSGGGFFKEFSNKIFGSAAKAEENLLMGPQGIVLAVGNVLVIVDTILLMLGSGAPYKGEEFRDEAATFSADISGMLKSALPTQWRGAGAVAYESQGLELQEHANTIAAADQRVADALEGQGDEIEDAREKVLTITDFVISLVVVEMGLLVTYWMFHDRAILAFMWVTFFMALALLGAANFIVMYVQLTGGGTEKAANKSTEDYQSVVNGVAAMLAGGAVAMREAPTELASTAANFSGIIGEAVDVPNGAGMVSVSPDLRAPVGALIGDALIAGQAVPATLPAANPATLRATSARPPAERMRQRPPVDAVAEAAPADAGAAVPVEGVVPVPAVLVDDGPASERTALPK